jgi:hypothetical protein
MSFIKLAFWLGLVVLLLPTDERQQARLYNTAAATVERAVTFCDRNGAVCAAGSDFWATFVKKAEFGARIAIDLIMSGGRKEEPVPTPVRLEPAAVRLEPQRPALLPQARPEPRAHLMPQGTLTPADLTPAWRGGQQRAGT